MSGLIGVDPDLHREAFAYGCISGAGGRKVRQPPREKLSGQAVDGGARHAEVLEFADADGVVLSRKVQACGAVECWLRRDIALAALRARIEAAAEVERVTREVAAYAAATRQSSRDQIAETYVLSSALLHAAARRQSKLGGLHDMDNRGDRIRGNLAAALERASKAGV